MLCCKSVVTFSKRAFNVFEGGGGGGGGGVERRKMNISIVRRVFFISSFNCFVLVFVTVISRVAV